LKLLYPHRLCQQFVTWTLPGSTQQCLTSISAWSSYLAFHQCEILRRCPYSLHFVWVWEYQERGALHCHAAVFGDPRGIRWLKSEFLPRLWRVLCRLERDYGVALRDSLTLKRKVRFSEWQAQCEDIETDITGYLVKYLTKFSDQPWAQRVFPTLSSWGCNRGASRARAALTYKIRLSEGVSSYQRRQIFVNLLVRHCDDHHIDRTTWEWRDEGGISRGQTRCYRVEESVIEHVIGVVSQYFPLAFDEMMRHDARYALLLSRSGLVGALSHSLTLSPSTR